MTIETRESAVAWLRAHYPNGNAAHNGDPSGPYCFYGGWASNFYPSPIQMERPFDGKLVTYPTVEHWFAANKAPSFELHEAIRVSPGPGAAKMAGRSVRMTPEAVAEWDGGKSYSVMLEGIRRKFPASHTNPLTLALLTTNPTYILEDSPTDAVWGLWNPQEHDWTGKNWLGMCLMERRRELLA